MFGECSVCIRNKIYVNEDIDDGGISFSNGSHCLVRVWIYMNFQCSHNLLNSDGFILGKKGCYYQSNDWYKRC